MNFFEQELRKIVGSAYPDAAYIGRACYVRLGEENRAKIQFGALFLARTDRDYITVTVKKTEDGFEAAGVYRRVLYGGKD